MKKLFLFMLLNSMGLSLYSAKVTIENKTDKLVFARVNNQNRVNLFYSDVDINKMMRRQYGALATYGIAEGVTALAKAVTGHPNFVPIYPHSSKALATPRFVTGVPGGDFGEADVGSGAKIYKITFLRIKGFNPQRSQYEEKLERYGFDFDEKKHIKFTYKGPIEDSIKTPIVEQFTYELKDNKIRRHESGKVVLEKWGKAKLVGKPKRIK